MTKKTIIKTLFGVFILATNTFAQINKKDWLVEGNLGNVKLSNLNDEYSSSGGSTNSDIKIFQIEITPTAAYFVSNKLALGLSTGVGFYNTDNNYYGLSGKLSSNSTSVRTTLTLAPIARFYFAKKNNFWFYGQAKVGTKFTLLDKEELIGYLPSGVAGSKQVKNTQKPSFVLGEVLVGVNYFFSKNAAFNSAIGYQYVKVNESQAYTNTNLITNVSSISAPYETITKSGEFSWNFGFTILLINSKNEQK